MAHFQKHNNKSLLQTEILFQFSYFVFHGRQFFPEAKRYLRKEVGGYLTIFAPLEYWKA